MRYLPIILFLVFSLRAEFTAPLGVPIPPWGITNTHWMYTNAGYTWDYGAGPVAYRTTTNGPYTHYVDKTAAGAADGTNTWGTPAKPRLTWPAEIPAGSVVEVHNGPYTFKNLSAKMQFLGRGTTNLPVFLRGVSTNDRPQLGGVLTIMGTYMIVENIDSYKYMGVRLDLDPPGIWTNNTHNVCFRNNHLHGLGNETGSGGGITGLGYWRFVDVHPNYASNIVIWNNSIHGFGPIVPGEEHDWVAAGANGYNCFDLWIIDNDLYNVGGDSVRIGSNSDLANPPTSHRAYIARNLMHDNGENSLDIKMWNDAVISENVMYGGFDSVSSSGARVVAHYVPTNIWLLANIFSSAPQGVVSAGVADMYVMGNLFHDLTNEGAQFFGGGDVHFIQNTFARCGQGIENIGGSVDLHDLVNNIIYPTTSEQIVMNLSGFSTSRMDHNLIYQDGNNLSINWLGTAYTSLLTLSNNTTAGDFCMNVDPIYLNAATNNFNVDTNSSPAYGTGTNIAFWTGLFFDRFGVSIDSYFKPNGTNMIGAYLTVVPDQPPAPEPVTGTRHPRGGRRFRIR